jgi:hypothetical protein
MESWSDDLSTRERVRRVATTLSRARSVNWVRREADVSWATAKDELDRLVEYGQLRRIHPEGEDASPRYAPDHRTRYLSRIRELVEENEPGDLRAEMAAVQEEIDAWREEYGVESRTDLEETLADDLNAAEIRDRNQVLRRWRRNEQTKRLLGHALRLYDDLDALDADPPNPDF